MNSLVLFADVLKTDQGSLQQLLILCNVKAAYCTRQSGFYQQVISAIRHSGVRKSSAMLMTDILATCIRKGKLILFICSSYKQSGGAVV